jgi:hypothetical protein
VVVAAVLLIATTADVHFSGVLYHFDITGAASASLKFFRRIGLR